jgi:hypothetical protein
VSASQNTRAVGLAVFSIACVVFVITTLAVKGPGSHDWGTPLATVWVTALVAAVLASLAAPVAARRSSLSPLARAAVFACSLPALGFVALLAYFFIAVVPRLA